MSRYQRDAMRKDDTEVLEYIGILWDWKINYHGKLTDEILLCACDRYRAALCQVFDSIYS